MKIPKTEPYQRPRHRAALHAWAVAATTVASIGMSASASAPSRDETLALIQRDSQSPSQDASRVAADWIEALQQADIDTAAAMMRLPAAPGHQQKVQAELEVMADLLAQPSIHAEPIAHRRAGHWALSMWQLESPERSLAPVIEPIALYHPSSDGLFESTADWQVVPQGFAEDVALKPLYNADYAALQDWGKAML